MENLLQIPFPPRQPLLGNYFQLARPDRIAQFERMANDFDGIYEIKLPRTRFYVVSSFQLVDELCDTKRFEKDLSPALAQSRRLVGDGLFTAYNDEPNWSRAHRILMPGFSMKAMKDYLPVMNQVTDQLLKKWREHGPLILDVAADTTRLTLETIAIAGFNYSFQSFSRDEIDPFVENVIRSLNASVRLAQRHPVMNFFSFRERRQLKKDIQYVEKLVDNIIEERKKDPELADKKDFLNFMLHKQDRDGSKLSMKNIRYQLITFLFAGHETTSGLLSFALYLLSLNPDVLQKVYEEVDQILVNGGDTAIGIAEISRLRYTAQVLKEALRLYPPAPGFFVTPIENTVIGDRYSLRKGDRCLILLSALHRDKKVWGADPERFVPERFSPENFAQIPTNAFRPFGNGPRICIGQNFAMVEATLVLARILKNFTIEDAGYRLHIAEGITIKPSNFKLKVMPRKA